MSVFKRIRLWADDASWLWMKSPAQANAFLAATLCAVALIAWIEHRGVWSLLWETSAPEPQNGSYQRLLNTAATAYRSEDAPLVLLIGSSAIRELTADDAVVSADLSRACGERLAFVNLGSSSQSFAESWALATLAPAERRRLVIFGVNPYRFDVDHSTVLASLNRAPSSLPTPWSLKFYLAGRTGRIPDLLDAPAGLVRLEKLGLTWSLPRLLVSSIGTPVLPAQDPFHASRNAYKVPVMTEQAKRQQLEEYVSWRLLSIEEKASSAVQLWRALGSRLVDGGTPVAFLIPPPDPIVMAASSRLTESFDRSVKALTDAFPLIDLRSSTPLLSEEFFDLQHLVASGRRKLHPRLLAEVGRTLGCNRP